MFSTTKLTTTLLLVLSAVHLHAAPLPLSTRVELLRISGVDDRDIEHSLNPTRQLPSTYEPPTSISPQISSAQHTLVLPLDTPSFAQSIDGYSTAKLTPLDPTPASASLGNLAITSPSEVGSSTSAFKRVRRWMLRRGDDFEEDMIVTGRMGEIKVRGR